MMIIGKSINKKGQTTRLEYSNGNIEEFYYDKDGNNIAIKTYNKNNLKSNNFKLKNYKGGLL